MIGEINHIHLNPPVDYIDGQTLTPMVKLHESISNPNTNEPLQQQRATSDSYLDRALAAAARVHQAGEWRLLPVEDRAKQMEQIASAIEKRLDEMATVESLTTGVVIQQSRTLMRLVPLIFRHVAKQARPAAKPINVSSKVEVQRVPWGPVALLLPWSAAAVSAAYKTANALAAGCPVILKPSQSAPHSVGILAEVIAACDLPAGVFQLVHGGPDVALKLAQDPRIRAVSFTGCRDDGRTIAQTCAADMKPIQLELHGVNTMLVLEDADLDAAAEGVVTALIALNGQWNRGLSRLLVHGKCYNALLTRVLDRLEALQVGESLSPESDLGPLIHVAHYQDTLDKRDQLLAHGGIAHVASRMPDLPGYFIEPTLITNCQPADTLQDIFGPVAAVHLFKDDAEALALANQPRSGAMQYVFGDDDHARQIASELETAGVAINEVTLYGLHPQTPDSGWGSSGLSDLDMLDSLRFFSGARAVGHAGS